MAILEKLFDNIISTLRAQGVYRIFASLVAVLTLAAYFGQGVVHPSDTIQTEAFLSLQGTPLAVLYRLLEFFSAPTGWIETVAAYIAASAQRAQVIGVLALLLGVAVSFVLTPDIDRNPMPAPSVQASTWWIAYATAIQTDIRGEFWSNSHLMLLWLGLLWGYYEVRNRLFVKGKKCRFMLDLTQLLIAIMHFITMFIPIIFSGHPSYESNNET
ncbi:hypothetical protein [Trueperella sp. LYQ141]|uniref:hypothetical protein n=1 Tax=Trueperella sp. LYQ141 TaxID=3391058 RepID=UPI003983B9A4